MSHLKAKAVYSSRRESAIDQMDVHQVAIKLKEIGINQNSAFLTWHQAPTDLRLLRRFLESAGYTDVLPLDKSGKLKEGGLSSACRCRLCHYSL